MSSICGFLYNKLGNVQVNYCFACKDCLGPWIVERHEKAGVAPPVTGVGKSNEKGRSWLMVPEKWTRKKSLRELSLEDAEKEREKEVVSGGGISLQKLWRMTC